MNSVAQLIRFDDRFSGSLEHVRPLCRSYAVVVFSSTAVAAHDVARPGLVLQWALGCLSDGEHEVLGVWERPDGDLAAVPGTALAEMHGRGVEVVGTGIGVGLGSGTLAPTFPRARGIDSVELAIESVAVQVPARHRAGGRCCGIAVTFQSG